MFIDKIKHSHPNLKMKHLEEEIKDAITFFINEPLVDFISEYYETKTCIPLTTETAPRINSYLPYNNIVLQFSCGNFIWLVQKDDIEQRKIIFGTSLSKYQIPPSRKIEILPIKNNIGCFSFQIGNPVIRSLLAPINLETIGTQDHKYERNIYEKDWGNTVFYFVKKLTDILLCKNIKIEEKKANKVKNEKRLKRNKIPIFSYQILKIQYRSKDSRFKNQNLWSNRVHLCRGHVKTYTKERPLFGRYVGNVWCPPHIKGNKSNGIIHKDYAIA